MTESTASAQPSSAADSTASVAPIASPSAAAPLSSLASNAAPPSSLASAAPPVSAASVASAAAAGSPTQYDLKVPAGVKVPDALIERTAANARVLGLTNEGGQKLLDAVLAEMQSADADRVTAHQPGGAAWSAQQAEWKAASMKDAEIGGTEEKLSKNVELAKSVVARFGGQDTKTFLEETGLGSHPAAVRLLAKIGAAMSESTLILAPSAHAPGKKSAAKAMYGDDGTGPQAST